MQYIVSIDRQRYQIIHDGGTYRPASIYDRYGKNKHEKFINITDIDIVYRSVLEIYVAYLNEDYAIYLSECSEYVSS